MYNGTYGFSYDVANRMASASQGTGTVAGYSYNAFGQRAAKTRPDSTNQHSTAYMYNPAGQLISETTYNNAGAEQQTQHYIWLGIVPVAMLQPAANDPDPKVIYLHSDHLDTPSKPTDQNHIVIWRWHSDAFGATAANDDPDNDGIATTINLRFAGQYYDAETQLHYNYFRDYDPTTGRYIQSDPIGLAGGVNTYTYVGSSPLVVTDPYGLWGTVPVIIIDSLKKISMGSACIAINSKYKAWDDSVNDLRDYRERLQRELDQAFYESCVEKYDTYCERRECWESSPFATDEVMKEIRDEANASKERNPWRYLKTFCSYKSLLPKWPKTPNGGKI